MRLRLSEQELQLIGKNKKSTNQYHLTNEESKKIFLYRGYDEALVNECIEQGVSPDKVNHYWKKSEHF